jgi:hypothetical protein
MSLGEKIDALYELRARRLAFERDIKVLKEQEAVLTDEIQTLLSEANIDGAKGKIATAARTMSIVPNVIDWDPIYEFVYAEKMASIFQKRLTTSLWTALHEDGILVPGTQPFNRVALSLTKR